MAASAIVLCGGSLAGLPSTAYGLGAGTLDSLSISPRTVVAGTSAQGTVTLAAAVGEDTVVILSSTNTDVVRVPGSVTIPAGAVSTDFTVTTVPFTGPGDFACVNGTAGGITQADCLNVNPVPSGPVLSSVTFSPATVAGGGPATGTVRFATVTDGAVVTLTSSNPAVVGVPAETVVSGGQSSGAFPVTTASVSAGTTVTVTATAFGVTRTGTLTVVPATTPPVPDVVQIKRATWKDRLLRIEATSTNPDAILSVYLTSSDSFMFRLTNLGGGRYADQRGWIGNPGRITVKSNFGGSATAST
ncbi:hypothetical protein AB0M95_04950 [Sphaerisporangium sp. NPDC051017]|uniref:hypothetical protein n=1 Tax=unclassified Sphaerisporangium TaxID=2630420 RepID=UPI0033D3388F